MAIPGYQEFMLPVLRFCADGQEHSPAELRQEIIRQFGFSAEDVSELLPSGRKTKLNNRVDWARSYLKAAGLLEYPRRGVFRISDRGREILARNPPRIDNNYLTEFPEFRAFKMGRTSTNESEATESESDQASPAETEDEATPSEVLESAYVTLRKQLADELLEVVRQSSWQFFEQIVLDVLVGMGYGGTKKDARRIRLRGGADEGIDGVINQDRLGLDTIYLQAKQWTSGVGRPEIMKFAGALQGQRATKGVFITTSAFTRDAREYAERIGSKIVLVEGPALADLMIDHNVGVSVVATYETKRVDSDYFAED